MKKAFGQRIAEHRESFVMMSNPLTETPADEEEERSLRQERRFEQMQYPTRTQ